MPDFKRDEQGNMVEDDLHRYIYDSMDRLIRVEKKNGGDMVVEYTYNHGGVPANIHTRKDARGLTETFRPSLATDTRELAIYEGDRRKEFYFFMTGDELPETLVVFEKNEANGTTSVYAVVQDRRGNVTHIASVDNNLNRTIVQRYEYTLSGELTVYDDKNQVTQNPPISRLLFRTSYYDPATGFYYICNRFYSPKIAQFISPDPFVKWNGVIAPMYDLPMDPIEYEHTEVVERARQQRLEIQRYQQATRNRRIELNYRNRNPLTRFGWFSVGVGKAFGNMIIEILRMGMDYIVPGNYGPPLSAIGRARHQGAGWGDIGQAAVVGIVHLPEKWWDSAWEGDMEGIGTHTTDIVLLIDGAVTLVKAVRPGSIKIPEAPNSLAILEDSSASALGRPIPHGYASEAEMITRWVELIRAEQLSRRPHLTQNPVRVVANRSENFAMDIYNTAAYVGGNPSLPRTVLRMSRGRHQPLLKPWDLTTKVGDSTLLELIQDRLPPWLLEKLERNGTSMRTVGDVDDVLRALWAYERDMQGTGLAAGHRVDLAINLVQTNFENRCGLMILEGYAKGNETMAGVIRNLFVPQWGRANSSMGGGLTASLSTRLPRYYGIRLPEGTPIRLVGVERSLGRAGR